jgi:serine/threonine protein kinase
MIPALPCVIQGYTFLRLIGRGGFSSVYLVQCERFQMDLCAKVMQLSSGPGSDLGWQTVENEVRVLTTLMHPNIIRLYDQFHDQSHFFLIIELCKGGSLQTELVHGKGFSLSRFCVLSRQIVSALLYCHQKRVAHHDIKLGNVLLDEFGQCKLADFGISVCTSSPGELTDKYAGSVQYEAPELLNKRPHDPFRADIWALGVLFAHMINGRTPWRCDTVGKLKQYILAGTYVLDRNTPPNVVALIAKMIRLDPTERITCAELARHPLFQHIEPVPPSAIMDCLAPLGRGMTRRVGITVEDIEQTTPGDAQDEIAKSSLGATEMTAENAKMLIIANRNRKAGFNIRQRPCARYHKRTMTRFISTYGTNPIAFEATRASPW